MTTDPTMRTPLPQEPSGESSGYVNAPGVAFMGYPPPDPAAVRRERVEFFAQQLVIERLRQGHTNVDPVQCAKEAKALYDELDRKDGDEGAGVRA